MALPPVSPQPGPLGAMAPDVAPRRWAVTTRSITWLGALLALLTMVLALAAAVHERAQVIETAQSRAELLSRVLEEHATRSVETVGLALAALSETLAAEPRDAPPQISQALAQTLANLPLLRAVAVLDGRGRVLASTTQADVDLTLDLARLGPLPRAGQDRLGPFVQGRSLAVLVKDVARAPPDAPRGVGFVPLVRALAGWNEGRLLVGLINADALANHQQQMLQSDHAAALLLSLQGRVLAATAEVPFSPGSAVPPLPAFTQYLPAVEHGTYVGIGTGTGLQVVAFRASRTRPLVVLVEMPLSAVLQPWAQDTWRLAVVALVVASMLLLLTLAVARSQRGRERAQAEVATREREMSAIVGSVQELIFRADAAGRLVFMNPHWQTVSPLPLDQALRRPLDELVHADSREAVRALFALDGTAEGALKKRSAQVQIGPSDAPRQFDVQVMPLHDGHFVMGFAGSAVDVTDRLADQYRLREQLAFNELLFEMLPLPVSMLDTQGRYMRVNRAWEDFTGRTRAAVLGQSARRLLPPEEAALHDEQDRQLLARGGSVRYDAARAMPDGSRRDLSLTKAVVPGTGGRAAGVLVAFMDVTEARDAERAVSEARDAAEEASRAKSEFIANISHELRTPLQSIIGFSELGQMRGRDAPKLAGMFNDIHKAGQRMLALVNDLLDVAKIESTVGTFHLERTDLRPLLREVVRELEPLLAERRLRVAFALGDMPLVAKVDPMRFQQVVRNVMANAIRFSPLGQTIDVVGGFTPRGEVDLCVRDHGPGIPPAELETIFEAFVQSSKTKDGSGGTGLGLAICRKIVEAHGGRIHAANGAGGGSEFRIRLPARGFAETRPGDL